jgi:hypothetical protein
MGLCTTNMTRPGQGDMDPAIRPLVNNKTAAAAVAAGPSPRSNYVPCVSWGRGLGPGQVDVPDWSEQEEVRICLGEAKTFHQRDLNDARHRSPQRV